MSWCALRYGSCALIRIVPQSTFSLCHCLLIVSDTLSVVKNRSHVKIRCKTLKLIQMFMLQVPEFAARSREEWEAQCLLWRTSFHPNAWYVLSWFSP